MDDCKRCGQRVSWNAGLTKLVGGYTTMLCTDCTNAWHAYFMTLPHAASKRALAAQLDWLHGRALAQDAPTETEWAMNREALAAWEEELFCLGQQWVETPVTVPTQEVMP